MAALLYNVSRGFVIFGERSLLLRGYNNHRIVVNSRRYVRALRRRPVAVLYPDAEREKLIKSKEAAVKMNQKLFTPKDKHREKVSERAGSQQWVSTDEGHTRWTALREGSCWRQQTRVSTKVIEKMGG